MAEHKPTSGEIDSASLALIALIDAKLTERVRKLSGPEDKYDAALIESRERAFLRFSPAAIAEARARIVALANE